VGSKPSPLTGVASGTGGPPSSAVLAPLAVVAPDFFQPNNATQHPLDGFDLDRMNPHGVPRVASTWIRAMHGTVESEPVNHTDCWLSRCCGVALELMSINQSIDDCQYPDPALRERSKASARSMMSADRCESNDQLIKEVKGGTAAPQLDLGGACS